ncbi:hypothetical protein, partial [Tepidimonas taiwanensis]|uniref:hypothetical protein n=1 Tax=Tepidimonas taiwanensis TaxID=307486 RepID=UPI001F3C2671
GAQRLHVPQHRLWIVPASFERSHCECMAQIVHTGARACWVAITELAHDPNEDHVNPCRRRGAAVAQNEEIIARMAHGTAGFEIPFQRGAG